MVKAACVDCHCNFHEYDDDYCDFSPHSIKTGSPIHNFIKLHCTTLSCDDDFLCPPTRKVYYKISFMHLIPG